MIKKIEANARRDRTIRALRRECESSPTCSELSPERRMNCVNECVSAECYSQIFGDEPLEDGEVDTIRSRQFTTCVRRTLHLSSHSQRRAGARRKRRDLHHDAL
mmetsp:Transcript_25259/g.30393  ORF Transcript_25259/g.30393 Transcript_25259/m.30393 type:complete len:104 (+) Transcript_25259:2-313(+)